jgi:hypothetical protein
MQHREAGEWLLRDAIFLCAGFSVSLCLCGSNAFIRAATSSETGPPKLDN